MVYDGKLNYLMIQKLVRNPYFEDVDIDIDNHDPIYSIDYEHVFYLAIARLWHMYIYMTRACMFIKINFH